MELPVWAQILLEEPDHNEVCKRTLVLMGHGSRDPRWREPFDRLCAAANAANGGGIRMAFMDFIEPTLMQVVEDCVREGVQSIAVLPLFLAAGAHVATDIPSQIDEIRTRFPQIRIEPLAPIGEDPRMFSLLKEIILERAA